MQNLGENHKQTLRFLVKSIREGVIPSEFVVKWHGTGSVVTKDSNGLSIPSATPLTLDLLEREGLILCRRQFETEIRNPSGGGHRFFSHPETHAENEISRDCVILDAGYKAVDSDFAPTSGFSTSQLPVEITGSLQRFRNDFPDITKLAFVIMRFGSTEAHAEILSSIQGALSPHGMIALRADQKEYHEDLYYNILTYIYGCRFGIAAFERIETDDFNPNVSLEVGYMLGLGKSVCLLKEKTLRTLQTDLAGKLYRPFDMQHIGGTLTPALLGWMAEKGFIATR